MQQLLKSPRNVVKKGYEERNEIARLLKLYIVKVVHIKHWKI